MAAQDYIGSLAQTSISYTTLINVQTIPGQNYWQVGLFVDSVVDAPSNLVAGYVVNTPMAMNATNYLTYVTLNSKLYAWLNAFWQVNTNSTIYVVVYNGTTHDIPTAHTALLTLAYFKMVFFGTGGETNQYQNDVVSLAGQQASNGLLTQTIVGTSSASVLAASGTGYGNIDALILASGYDAMVSYSAVTSYNEMLQGIGLALNLNNTANGNPVGNNLDFTASPFLVPSQNAGYTNISALYMANLTNRNIGYFATVGDGSGNSYLNNRLSLKGRIVTANWLVNYCNFVCSLKTATFLTSQGLFTFKNNQTYQQILGLIYAVISPYQTSSLGRLSNFVVTAPTFNNLPATGGTVLTIPNAWSANFNDRIATVNVNGTLTVTL